MKRFTLLLGMLLIPVAAYTQGEYYSLDTPCRLVDTRVNTILTCANPTCDYSVDKLYAFLVKGDETRVAFKDRGIGPIQFTFEDQGGKAGGCGIPMDATAARLNVAVSPIFPSNGHVRMWAFGIAYYMDWADIPVPNKAPEASVLNWQYNPYPNAWFSTETTVKLCNEASANYGDCNEDVLVSMYGSTGLLKVDVVGYFK